MSKSKPLSRNKTIKILHESTGKTYKECRAILKSNKWDLNEVFGLNPLIAALQRLPEITERLQRAFSAFAEAASAAVIAFNDTLSEALSND